MLDLGWSELLVVAVIALIVVGPKELPALLRTIGKIIRVVRNQANEFRSHFDDAIKDTEFEQVRKELEDLKSDAEVAMRDTRHEIENKFRDLDKTDSETETEVANGTVHGVIPQHRDTVDDHSDAWMDDHNQSILDAEQQAAQADIKAGSADETGTSHIASDNAHDNAGATEDTHTAKHTASVESDKAGVAT